MKFYLLTMFLISCNIQFHLSQEFALVSLHSSSNFSRIDLLRQDNSDNIKTLILNLVGIN